jgi:alkylation response protein AidB-like acyl-CoA dehydrogenase
VGVGVSRPPQDSYRELGRSGSWTSRGPRNRLAYRESVIQFARAHLNEGVVDRDDTHTFSSEAWHRCARFGIQGLPVPEEYGGQGADPLTIVLALEALGYACKDNGLLFSLGAQMWSCEDPLIRFGSEDTEAAVPARSE